jgi:hypothetical protein
MRAMRRSWYLALTAVTAACGITDVQAPALQLDEEIGEPFVESLDAAALESVVQAGSAEFELVLLEDGLTAAELSVRTDDLGEDEEVRSQVAAFTQGRLMLHLGGIEVTLRPDTRFWIGEDPVSGEAFAHRVQENLSSGVATPLVARRLAVDWPQAPEDGTFVANDVTVGGDGSPGLRLRVGPGNLARVSNPTGLEPDAWLKVLGRNLRLRLRDGTTNAFRHRHRFDRVVEFDGAVASIDLKAGTLRTTEGVTIRVSGRTDVVRRRGHARSLRAAAEALEEGHRVHVRGLGVVQEDRGRLLALRIALKIEEVEREPVVIEFEGVVTDVEPGDVGMIVTLAGGTTVLVGPDAEVLAADEHSPASIEEVVDALAAGREVVARGRGEVLVEHPVRLRGLRVVFESEAPAEQLPTFVGTADYVSFDGSVVLVDGTILMVTSATEVVAADARSPASVQELLDMLDVNRRVDVSGVGTLDAAGQFTAVRLVLTAVVGSFDLDVLAIDPDAGGLILAGGSFALLTQATVITAVGSGPTDLFGVDAALAGGASVRARGTGYLRGRTTAPGDPENYEVIAVEFEQTP